MATRKPHPPVVNWRVCVREGCLRGGHLVPGGFGCAVCEPHRYMKSDDVMALDTPIDVMPTHAELQELEEIK